MTKQSQDTVSPTRNLMYAAQPKAPSIYDGDDPNSIDINICIRIDRAKSYPITDRVATYRDYAAGKHRVILTDQQKAILRGILDNDFADNICHLVCSEAESRIVFRGWQTSDEGVKKFLDNLYLKQKLRSMSGEITYDALRDGDHAVALGWCNGEQEVELYKEYWWDEFEGVFIAYDAKGGDVYGVKEWWDYTADPDLPIKRRNVWFEDRLERYAGGSATGDGVWAPTNIPEDNVEVDGQTDDDVVAWSIAWRNPKTGDPLGLPLVHFPNSARGSGNYGMSELAGGVIGFQDQINDLGFAMSGAGRLTAFQMITIAGMKLALDPHTGKPTPPAVGPGQVLISEDHQTKFGSIAAGDMSQLIKLYESKLTSVARMTRTPRHSITGGDWPSGDAILRAERPAVGKADRQVARFADAWQEVAVKAIRIYNAFNTKGETLNEDAVITAVFDPTDKRDQLSKSIIVKNLLGFISNQEALRMMGYSDEDAKRIQDEIQAEAQLSTDLQIELWGKGVKAGMTMTPQDAIDAKTPPPANGKQGTPGQSNDKPNQASGAQGSDNPKGAKAS